MKNNKRIYFLIIASVLLILTGCYYDYLTVTSKYSNGVYTNKGTVIFYHSIQASQPPKGITRFPDGGMHKNIFRNTSLYELDTNNKELNKIFDFGGIMYSSYQKNLSIQNNKLLFNIIPTMGWQLETENDTSSGIDKKLYPKNFGFFSYDLESNELKRFFYDGYGSRLSPDNGRIAYVKEDSTGIEIRQLFIDKDKNQLVKKIDTMSKFSPVFWINNKQLSVRINNIQYFIDTETGKMERLNQEIDFHNKNISMSEIKRLIQYLNYSDWGFDLSKYWKKNNNQYIYDIVHLNGNFEYRKAIIEELSKELNDNEMEAIIDKMGQFAESLEGFQKSKYVFYSKETKEYIIRVIKKKYYEY
ncbi:MAG: hypothetical protein SVU94_10445 [Bacteroidota bacterium]|nr:hypothetical protein [Bacteroidota bacterium]